MSRIIVKGLPKYADEDKIRTFFNRKGEVTDVKLMKKRNGESRRFAFVGFKSIEDAEQAVGFFNKAFMDTSRLEVEQAKTFSDPSVPLSFKEKKRLDTERLREREERLLQQEQRQLAKKQKTKSSIDQEIESNPQLKEFLEMTKPSGQAKSYEDVAKETEVPSSKDLEKALAEQDSGNVNEEFVEPRVKNGDCDDEYEDFQAKDDEGDDEDEPMMTLGGESEGNEQDNDIETKDENMTDLEWLQQKRVRMIENETRSKELKTQENNKKKQEKEQEKNSAPTKVKEPEPKPEEQPDNTIIDKINETGRLFIRNILYSATEEDFRNLFSQYGSLEEVHLAIDTRTGKSKGYVYIQFVNAEDAVTAFNDLDKQIFQGRLLHILPADKKKDHRLDEFDLKNLPLKKQRELKRKAQASKAQFSWNSLYMNQDAVLESVAAKMGVKKNELIDAQSSDSAVKQALAEAHVIGDVRKYFETKGVDIASFNNSKEKDDRIILVKNFTFGTTIEQLGDMFSQYGEIKRLLMPPAGTIAIIEFRDAPSARAAFSKLAYKRFDKSILYLEKGPKDLFSKEPEAEEGISMKEQSTGIEAKVSAKDILDNEGSTNDTNDDTNDVEGPTVSVFVKNLNFSTTSSQLTEAFKGVPGFVVAVVKTKPDPKHQGKTLSMGFGFVEFSTKDQANNAISIMDGHVLDGHKLQLKVSNRIGGNTSKKPKQGKKSTKIIIKNLPFEASRKDIVELFGTFGNIKSARVPKKFDRSARGFAFVEFVLLKEAETAMSQLEGVHLLGRRLVMDYAENEAVDAEAEIERMTNKVKQQYGTQQLAASRGGGKNMLDMDEDGDGGDGIDDI